MKRPHLLPLTKADTSVSEKTNYEQPLRILLHVASRLPNRSGPAGIDLVQITMQKLASIHLDPVIRLSEPAEPLHDMAANFSHEASGYHSSNVRFVYNCDWQPTEPVRMVWNWKGRTSIRAAQPDLRVKGFFWADDAF